MKRGIFLSLFLLAICLSACGEVKPETQEPEAIKTRTATQTPIPSPTLFPTQTSAPIKAAWYGIPINKAIWDLRLLSNNEGEAIQEDDYELLLLEDPNCYAYTSTTDFGLGIDPSRIQFEHDVKKTR